MTDYNNGKIHGWNGGDCPVHPESKVITWHRNSLYQRTYAGEYWWDHRDTDGDIIAFQVIKAYVEPKVIWVNETKGVVYEAYTSEEAARRTVYFSTSRIAVKYVEARDD